MSDASEEQRFRDIGELRYSLRSVATNAPWIRNVVLVTDNQVPAWLDLQHPGLRVVTHAEFWPDPSLLPTFSSPAIEANLHRIPGLSRRFLYFNDDVFLASPVAPDDFITVARGQRTFPAWPVPPCAEGCFTSWVGDGTCDQVCNTADCRFDGGDCKRAAAAPPAAASTPAGRRAAPAAAAGSMWEAAAVECSTGCALGWVGDGRCDPPCDVARCGFDAGDCGMERVWSQLPGFALPASAATARDEAVAGQLAFVVASDAPATYVNLTAAFPRKILSAEQSNTALLPAAAVSRKTLVLVFDPFPDPARGDLSTIVLAGQRGGKRSPVLWAKFNVTRPAAEPPAPAHGNGTTRGGAGVRRSSVRPRPRAQAQAQLSSEDELWDGLAAGGEKKSAADAAAAAANSRAFLDAEMRGIVQAVEGRHGMPAAAAAEGEDTPSSAAAAGAARAVLDRTSGAVPTPDLAADGGGVLGDGDGDDMGLGAEAEAAAEQAAEAVVDAAAVEAEAALAADLPQAPDRVDPRFLPRAGAAKGSSGDVAPGEGVAGEWPPQEVEEAGGVPSPETSFTATRAARRARAARDAGVDRMALPLSAGTPREQTPAGQDEPPVPAPPLPPAPAGSADPRRFAPPRAQPSPPALHPPRVVGDGSRAPRAPTPPPVPPVPTTEPVGVEWPAGQPSPVEGDALPHDEMPSPPPPPPSEFPPLPEMPWAEAAAVGGAEGGGAGELPPWAEALDDDASAARRGAPAKRDSPGSGRGGKGAPRGRRGAKARGGSGKQRRKEGASSPRRRLLQAAAASRGGRAGSRRLLDDFADSLRFVDGLLNVAYGSEEGRRVVGHVPHLVDANIVEAMQAKWAAEFNATGRRRFRSPEDMQFSFTYENFMASEAEPFDAEAFWNARLDTDRSGTLSGNELTTLAEYLNLKQSPVSTAWLHLAMLEEPPCAFDLNMTLVEEAVASGEAGMLLDTDPVRLEDFVACTAVTDLLEDRVPQRAKYRTEVARGSESKFYSVRGPVEKVRKALMRMRVESYKFICLNDDVSGEDEKEASEIAAEVLAFLEFKFPTPSPFELPAGWENPVLRLDELRAEQRAASRRGTAVAAVILLGAVALAVAVVCTGAGVGGAGQTSGHGPESPANRCCGCWLSAGRRRRRKDFQDMAVV